MRKHLTIFSLLIILLSIYGCSSSDNDYIQKDPNKVEVKLLVKNNTEIPLKSNAKSLDAKIAKRFIVEVYQIDGENPLERKEIIYDVSINEDYTRLPIFLQLAPNKYKFVIWSDYIDKNTGTDLLYTTSSLSAIELTAPYTNSMNRESLFANTDVEIAKSNSLQEVKLDLHHATASFKLVALDLQDFIKKQESLAPQYYVSVEYTFFYPMGFDATKGEPNQASRGTKLTTTFSIDNPNENECDIVFDHVFSRPEGATLTLNLTITSAEGEIINIKRGVQIPYKRGYTSIAKANFLTDKPDPNVGIDVEFEEDINIDLDTY